MLVSTRLDGLTSQKTAISVFAAVMPSNGTICTADSSRSTVQTILFTGPSGVRGRVDPRTIVRLEGLGKLKNPMTSPGMELAPFRLVA
jgi:hypothetical protein